MKLGLWYDLRQHPDDTRPYSVFYSECVEEITVADEAGFDQVWFSEHHFVDDGYLPSQLVAAAYLAGKTRRIELGTNVLLLPLYHPLRVAEDAAVLDLLSGGRFTLGVGAGYVDFEFETLGANRKFRPSLMEEGIAVLRQAFDEGRTGFGGSRWSFPDLPFTPKPERRLPIYVGANEPVAIRRAARLGDGFLCSAPLGPASVRPKYQAWLEGLEAAGRGPLPFIVSGWLYLSKDGDKAWEEAAPCIAYQLSRYREWGTDRGQPVPVPLHASDLDRSNFPFVGTPERVLSALQSFHAEVPFDGFCFWGRLPGLDHHHALASARLFIEQVAPGLRD